MPRNAAPLIDFAPHPKYAVCAARLDLPARSPSTSECLPLPGIPPEVRSAARCIPRTFDWSIKRGPAACFPGDGGASDVGIVLPEPALEAGKPACFSLLLLDLRPPVSLFHQPPLPRAGVSRPATFH